MLRRHIIVSESKGTGKRRGLAANVVLQPVQSTIHHGIDASKRVGSRHPIIEPPLSSRIIHTQPSVVRNASKSHPEPRCVRPSVRTPRKHARMASPAGSDESGGSRCGVESSHDASGDVVIPPEISKTKRPA